MNTTIKVLAVSLFAATAACGHFLEGNDMKTISGEVYYLQRIALPNHANVTVTLSDVSLMDAPSEVISSQTYITDGKQVPLPFSLAYSPEQIQARNRYSISARIEVDGKLMFISDSMIQVLHEDKNYNDVKIKLVSIPQ